MSDSQLIPIESARFQKASTALDVLLSRYSVGRLIEPGPTVAEQAQILDVGLRAPDHGRLRPWRFVVIRGVGRVALAELLIEALGRREPNPPTSAVQRLHQRITSVPLIIGVGAKVILDGPIPEIEQLLSAGAAVMNLLNAIHTLGYAGTWVTGEHVYDRRVNEELGFVWPSRLVGLVFVGSAPEGTHPMPRPEQGEYVREWWGSSASRPAGS